jgi:hypothetical protein
LWFSDVVCVICCVVGGGALAVAVWHLGGARELISLCNYVSTTNATLLVNSLTAVLISHGQPQMQGSANLASTLLLVASSLIPLSVAHVSLHSKPDHSSGEQLIKRRDTYTLPHKRALHRKLYFTTPIPPKKYIPSNPSAEQHWWNLSIRFFAYVQMSFPQPLSSRCFPKTP